MFRGSIVDVDESEDDRLVLYHIEYEDEGQEDLSSKDCADTIERHRQIENGEIDKWAIGDE